MTCVRYSLGKQFQLSDGVMDISMTSWIEVTSKQYAPQLHRWFCSENDHVKIGTEI